VFREQSLYFLFDFDRSLSPLYLLGVLNSRLMDWYYKTACLTNKESIAQVKKVQLDQLPIRRIDHAKNAEEVARDGIVASVSSMLALHKQLAAAKSAAQKVIIQRQIDATDAEIDRLVYDLYGLTAEEIALIENSTSEPKAAMAKAGLLKG
jgi:hypothetical protein